MRMPGRRTALLVATALAVLTGGYAVTATIANAATTGCRVDYKITNEWQGGFGADVTVTNLGNAINGWTLTWTFTTGQSITQAWNATVTQSGTAVTAKNVGYNAAIAANASVNFGFNGAFTATNPVPAAFTLNGTPCTGTATVSPSASCSTSASASPATPSTPASSAPASSAAASTSPAATGTPTIWMAGDSTMANASACPIGWGSQFAQYFTGNVKVNNSAVAGRSIQTWLYDPNVTTTMGANGECVINPTTYSTRWQAMLDTATGMKAGDYLFIQFGINDGSTTCNRHVGSARYKELLTMMATAAKARGAHPVFLTPVAAITCSGSTAVGNRGFLTETREAGAAANVPVVDLHTLSVAYYNSIGLCPNNGDYTSGTVGAFFCNDHTHFEADGARQIAGVVATALRNQKVGPYGYLK